MADQFNMSPNPDADFAIHSPTDEIDAMSILHTPIGMRMQPLPQSSFDFTTTYGPSPFSPSPPWSAYATRQNSDTYSRNSPPSLESSSISTSISNWEEFTGVGFQHIEQRSYTPVLRDELSYRVLDPVSTVADSSCFAHDWSFNPLVGLGNDASPRQDTPTNCTDQLLVCPEGCENVKFSRKYDTTRHIKEQHRCPYQGCEARKFTPDERRRHSKMHNERGLGFDCGSCRLFGLSVKPFTRSDKLKKHFKELHGTHDHIRYSDFQCMESPCWTGNKSCGGVFFTSQEELDKHFRIEHLLLSSMEVDAATTSKSRHIGLGETRVNIFHIDGQSAARPNTNLLVESKNAGNVNKHPLDNALESSAKRSKPWCHTPNTCSPILGESNDATMFESPLPQNNTNSTNTDGMVPHSDPGPEFPVREASLTFSMFDLPALSKLTDFKKLLTRLEDLHITTLFDTENDSIVLRGACAEDRMCRAQRALELLMAKVKTENLWEFHATDAFPDPIYRRHKVGRHIATEPYHRVLPIRPIEDADAVKTWRLLLPSFHNIVQNLPVGESYSAALVRQEVADDVLKPIIRFCSSAGQSDLTRKKIRSRLHLFYDQNGRQPISVHFSEGTTVRLVGGGHSSSPNTDSPSNDLKTFPHHLRPWETLGMGASIGMSSCRHQSATSGGHITIDNLPFMLSVDHFIYPEPRCGCEKRTELSSPSPGDLHYLRGLTKTKVEELKLKIRDSKPGLITLDKATERASKGEEVEELNLYMRFARDLNKPDSQFLLGPLAHKCNRNSFRESRSTRWQSPDGGPMVHRMDWSLTNTIPKRQGYNVHRYCRKAELGLEDFKNELIIPEGAGAPCERIGDFRGTEEVFYVGQASGLREGFINPEPVLVKARDRTTYEWAMLTDSPDKENPSKFEGDSGAWILDKENRLLGLLWAWEQGMLLFTPIQEIFDDIRELLGLGPDGTIDLLRHDPDFEAGISRLSRKHVDPTDELPIFPEHRMRPFNPSIETAKAKTKLLVKSVDEQPPTLLLPAPTTPTGSCPGAPSSPAPSLTYSIFSAPSTPTPPTPEPALAPLDSVSFPALTLNPKGPTIESLCLPEDIDIPSPTTRKAKFAQLLRLGWERQNELTKLAPKAELRAVQTW
ncbi:hypothetical protein BDV95DRAFT_275358 [Massariosphaeria phaeospora]|uniref:C2H2-type domain-containing protein n=1 Tax=Massariosphaeria phaeospora TaxID=100035 RepID=A0A7C8MF87_9PLEO|nr:hypothetical protein BDV95DRAFT_275358 [Massariosphaeria phaeospora]